MKTLSSLNDPEKIASQYKTASNLTARIHLHQRCSVNQYGWFRWVFDHFDIPPQARILELGCGAGTLWQENRPRIPDGWDILLTDFSAGMLDKARQSLARQTLAGQGPGGSARFRFEQIDAQAVPLPFEDGTFAAVIANHMLYHVSGRPALLAEIRRILKPAGHLYATTVGENHLGEIPGLMSQFDPQLAPWGTATKSFTLENGGAQLSPWFEEVSQDRYEDALVVTDAGPLIDFLLSGFIDVPEERHPDFKAYINQLVAASGGAFHISKDSGIFVGVRER